MDISLSNRETAGLGVGLQRMLSIVIPARNEEKYLRRCLDGLILAVDAWGGEHEVILVDNGSSDCTAKIAVEKGCRVIEEQHGRISHLRNVGAWNSRGDVIAFLDADCLVAPEWIKYCLEAFSDEKIAIVATRAVPDRNSPTWVEEGWYRLMSGAKRPDYPDWVGTSNLFIRKDDFFKVGGFDENLETAEDINICYDLRRRGKLIYLEKRVNTVHLRESKTLNELFKREYWRGKSTLRSFVRNSLHLEELPSVLLPAGTLLLICSMIFLAAARSSYVMLPFGMLIALPCVILIKKQVAAKSARRLLQCYVVSLVYMLARSCALMNELRCLAVDCPRRKL